MTLLSKVVFLGIVQQKLYSVKLENFSDFGTVSNARLKSDISEFVFVFKGFGTCPYSQLPHFETHHSCNEYDHGGESSSFCFQATLLKEYLTDIEQYKTLSE